MLTIQKIEETLRGLSRDYAGDHLNAGVVLGRAIKRLREANDESAGARVTFRHGPVTITVEGLPESIKPTGVSIFDLHVHATSYGSRREEQHEAFVSHFRELGGSETFPVTESTKPFSVHSKVVGVDEAGDSTGFVSRLQLYPPKHEPEANDVVPAIDDALDREWIERTADGAASALREAGS